MKMLSTSEAGESGTYLKNGPASLAIQKVRVDTSSLLSALAQRRRSESPAS